MPRTTILFGILLIALGSAFFAFTGNAHPTALIPSVTGLLLLLCGWLAQNPARRALWMHIAVTIGLLACLGGAGRIIAVYAKAHGAPLAHPLAVYESIAMTLLLLVFVILCVRSFIAARRARTA